MGDAQETEARSWVGFGFGFGFGFGLGLGLGLGLARRSATVVWKGDISPYISLHLPTSPYITLQRDRGVKGHEPLQAVVPPAVERPLVVPARVHQVDVAARGQRNGHERAGLVVCVHALNHEPRLLGVG